MPAIPAGAHSAIPEQPPTAALQLEHTRQLFSALTDGLVMEERNFLHPFLRALILTTAFLQYKQEEGRTVIFPEKLQD